MKVAITKIDGRDIIFSQEGAPELQKFPLAEWVKTSYVSLGKAEIEIVDGQVTFCTMKKDVPKPAAKKPASPTNKRWEDDMVTFETLLTKAHGLKVPFSIKTEMLQLDVEKKYALFKAEVIIPATDNIGPRVFQGHGDATIDNVKGEHIRPHFIRMAETRAIVRALRWYTNNGVTEEEKK